MVAACVGMAADDSGGRLEKASGALHICSGHPTSAPSLSPRCIEMRCDCIVRPWSGSAQRVRTSKRARQQLIREIVGLEAVTSQHDLVSLLAARGVRVTQATVSRDVTELGLVKVGIAGRHVYASPEGFGRRHAGG